MGFLSRLSSSSSPSPSSKLAQLQADLELKPKDTRLMLELAAALKASGDLAASIDMSLRAARLHLADGVHQKGIAIAKQLMASAPHDPKAFEFLVECYQTAKLKEDERGALKQLVKLYSQNPGTWSSELARANARLEALGPGR